MSNTIEANSQLVLRALAGEADAFARLIERHRPTVFSLCLRWTRNPTDADDLTQETLLRAYSHLGQMREPDRFGPWLAQIAANLCKNWRSRAHHNLLPLSAAEQQADEPDLTHCILLREAMATLSPEVRQAIEWFYLEGFSQKEIAGLWRVPQSTVKGRLDAGRLRLRKEFQKMGLLSAEVSEEAVLELRVALTDADPRETKALRAALKAAGYGCTVIKQEELLLPRLHRLKPDLLVLNMPFAELDQNDILLGIRADYRLRELPVMLLSPRHDRGSVLKAWKSGVNVYLTNVRNVHPFVVHEVMVFVQRVLSGTKELEYIALAVECAWRGQTEPTLRYLEMAIDGQEKHWGVARAIRDQPAFNYLREEPEFIALSARLISEAEIAQIQDESKLKMEEMEAVVMANPEESTWSDL
jgi:RNA polymerase sigma factor (sigma-70 family)